MIGEVIAAAIELFEQKILVGSKPINARAMGGAEKAGKRKTDSAESVLVSVSNFRIAKEQQSGGYAYEVKFVAWCGSKNKTSDFTRSLIAASMAAQLTKLLESQNWGLRSQGVGKAKFESAVDRTRLVDANSGLAIWEVSWWQEMPFTVGAGLDLSALYLLQEVQGETDLYGSLDETLEMTSSTLPVHGNLQDDLNV